MHATIIQELWGGYEPADRDYGFMIAGTYQGNGGIIEQVYPYGKNSPFFPFVRDFLKTLPPTTSSVQSCHYGCKKAAHWPVITSDVEPVGQILGLCPEHYIKLQKGILGYHEQMS